MASGTPVPAPASVRARVYHRRERPFTYAFEHGTTMWLVDVAAPNAAFPRWLAPFASIRARDHFAAHDERPLPAKVRTFLDAQSLGWTAHRVLMLATARSLGYVFDPLSTFFCFDAAGRLEGVLAEVHNTYGERHCYPLAITGPPSGGNGSDGSRSAGVDKAGVDKEFYVSPFFAVEGRYDIRARLTDSEVAVAISLTREGRVLFTGSVHGELEPATGPAHTLRTVAGNPVPAQRVSALIRWHGIRLWLRRLPVVPRRPHQVPKGMR